MEPSNTVTCASRTSSACTPCRFCRSSRSPWSPPGGGDARSRDAGRGCQLCNALCDSALAGTARAVARPTRCRYDCAGGLGATHRSRHLVRRDQSSLDPQPGRAGAPPSHERCAVTPEQVFSIVNLIATAAWLALAHSLPDDAGSPGSSRAPSFRCCSRSSTWASWRRRLDERQAGSRRSIATLFSNPWALLAGWTHYLAFDLLIGTWEGRRTRARTAASAAGAVSRVDVPLWSGRMAAIEASG